MLIKNILMLIFVILNPKIPRISDFGKIDLILPLVLFLLVKIIDYQQKFDFLKI